MSYWRRKACLVLGCVVALSAIAVGAQQPAPKQSFRLIGLTPDFWKLVPQNAQLQTLASGFGFTEGPVWDRSGFVWVSDETLNKIFQVDAAGNKKEIVALGDPDGNTYDRQHRLIDCASVLRAIIRLSPDGKSWKVLADRFQGKRFNSPNDVVLGPDGAFYFTDPTLDLPKGEKQEIPFQGVYRLATNGEVRLLTHDLAQPNGIAFSPDGRFLYLDDSKRRDIRVYRFHPDGTVSDGREFGSEIEPGVDGVPDGMRLDRAGHLFVVGPGGIWVWSPAGVHLGTIRLPEQPANLSWGGPANDWLYITATTSVYTIHLSTHGFVPYD